MINKSVLCDGLVAMDDKCFGFEFGFKETGGDVHLFAAISHCFCTPFTST